MGYQGYRYEPSVLCGTAWTPQTSGTVTTNPDKNSTAYDGSLVSMLNRGMYDLALRDPHRHIGWNRLDQQLTTEHTPVGDRSLGQINYLLPTRGWLYQPQGITLKFHQKMINTYFNPTNIMQYVTVTTMARKRSQLRDSSQSSDGEIVDSFNFDLSENYVPFHGLTGPQSKAQMNMVVFAPELDRGIDDDHVLSIARAGERIRRWAWPRTSRYDGMQMALLSRASPVVGTIGDTGLNGQLSTGYALTSNTQTSDYRVQQTLNVAAGSADSPYREFSPDWLSDPRFNPTKNPYLKKLFWMHQRKMALAPGSSASITLHGRGSINA